MSHLDNVLAYRVWELNNITGERYKVEGCNKEGRRVIHHHVPDEALDIYPSPRKIIPTRSVVNPRRMTRPAMIDLLNAMIFVGGREHDKYYKFLHDLRSPEPGQRLG